MTRFNLFDRRGKRVHAVEEADFFVPQDKSLRLHRGQFYLYPKAKAWDNLTLEEKNSAKNLYLASAKLLMSPKMKLQMNDLQELKAGTKNQNQGPDRRFTMKIQPLILIEPVVNARFSPKTSPQNLILERSNPLVQKEKLKQQMAMAIKPNANALALLQLTSPQNTGATRPPSPSPYDLRLRPKK